jgi:Spy/CpxP family protein refolding chaperone
METESQSDKGVIMKRNILSWTICALAAFALLIPALASAQTKAMPGKRPVLLGDELMSTLALSKDQKAQIDTLRMDMDRDLRPLHEDQQRLMHDFDMIWRGPNPDDRGLKSVMRKLVKVSAKIDARGFEFQIALFNILSDKQRRALSDKSRELCEKAPGDMWLGQPGAMNACPPPPQAENPPPGGNDPKGGQPGNNPPPAGGNQGQPGNNPPPAGAQGQPAQAPR